MHPLLPVCGVCVWRAAGLPPDDELAFIHNEKALAFVKGRALKPTSALAVVFEGVDPLVRTSPAVTAVVCRWPPPSVAPTAARARVCVGLQRGPSALSGCPPPPPLRGSDRVFVVLR